jgi:hypothetical protein
MVVVCCSVFWWSDQGVTSLVVEGYVQYLSRKVLYPG